MSPVPQMVEQLPNVLRFFLTRLPVGSEQVRPIAEQVIDVPKIPQNRTQQRLVDSLRRRRNSWWKCPRSYPILLCTGMWSRTSTFQFLIVVVVGEVFKMYPLDRIQQRLVEQITLKLQFRVLEVFKISSRDRLPLLWRSQGR